MTFRNRIVEYGVKPADQFTANPRNPKFHPEFQRQVLTALLGDIGFVMPVVEFADGYLLDGHERVWEALEANSDVPFVQIDIRSDDEEGLRALATVDPVGRLAEHDRAQLDALLRDVQSDSEHVQRMLAELAAENGLYLNGEPPPDPGAQVDRAAELQQVWQVERGDVWECGKHRLMCGDSTNAEDVARVMAGGRADMVFTDPPYGVAVGDKNKYLNSIAPSNRVEQNLENDTLEESELVRLLCASFDCAIAHCTAGATWYVAAPPGPLHVLFGQVLKDRGIWRQTIQWVKNNATFAPLGVDYHWRCEPIFYGWLPNAAHHYYGGRQQDTVWNIDRPTASPEHPTMKPVELVARAIANSSQREEVVFDPFLGSGTTMVAAQQLGRVCRGIEIEPKYVSVTLDRMQRMGVDVRRG